MVDPISIATMIGGGLSSMASGIGAAFAGAAGAGAAAAATPVIGSLTAGGALSAAGAAVTAGSTVSSYLYQSSLAAQNAKIQKQNAVYASMAGEQQASNSGMKSRDIEGKILAAQGASGLNVNTGTSSAVQAGQHLVNETNQTVIRSNAAKQAYDYEVSAASSSAQSKAYSNAAIGGAIGGTLNLGASILGSGNKVADQWYKGKQIGLYGDDTNSWNSGSL